MATPPAPVLALDLPFATKRSSGKVREVFELGGDVLLVTTDRVSAFDVVMRQGIPGKGRVLNGLSAFWFDQTRTLIANHMLSTDVDAWDDVPRPYRDALRGRTMRCRKAEVLPVEWVVRGYLTGSGYKDYLKTGSVCGVTLPKGLQHASQIEPAILTPTTKAKSGHDLPLTFAEVESLVGKDLARRARDVALAVYRRGHELAKARGFVIADTKFELGLADGELILIDECLTPDSSRFWPAAGVRPGAKPESFDKQVLRDWLESSGWSKEPPPPDLPPEVVARTAQAYAQIFESLTGRQVG